MKNTRQLSPKVIYELVAEVGFRKHFHLGGLAATEKMVELCNPDRGQYVLDVGCASGKTACYVAQRYDCTVVGVDILERMVERANERASREGLAGSTSFRVGDAQERPFADDTFDIVISEFVAGLLDDKRRGLHEYLRVAKPGGYIALNEATWVKTPPPPGLVAYLSGVFGIQGEILDAGGWVGLLTQAGLADMMTSVHKADALSSKWADLADVLRVWHRVLYLYLTSSTFRTFIKETLSVPEDLLDYFGYGVYVGRKWTVDSS